MTSIASIIDWHNRTQNPIKRAIILQALTGITIDDLLQNITFWLDSGGYQGISLTNEQVVDYQKLLCRNVYDVAITLNTISKTSTINNSIQNLNMKGSYRLFATLGFTYYNPSGKQIFLTQNTKKDAFDSTVTYLNYDFDGFAIPSLRIRPGRTRQYIPVAPILDDYALTLSGIVNALKNFGRRTSIHILGYINIDALYFLTYLMKCTITSEYVEEISCDSSGWLRGAATGIEYWTIKSGRWYLGERYKYSRKQLSPTKPLYTMCDIVTRFQKECPLCVENITSQYFWTKGGHPIISGPTLTERTATLGLHNFLLLKYLNEYLSDINCDELEKELVNFPKAKRASLIFSRNLD
jgi:hypothetical protein